MNKFAVLSCLLIFLFNSSLTSQSRLQNRKKFVEAESWILFEDFKEAIPLYQQLIKNYPQNSNLNYRIGQCYLNIPGEKYKAIGFLQEAVKNINPEYKAGKFREKGAPHDALFYLGKAYMINYQLDKAIESFDLFRKSMDNNVYDSSTVNFQIQSCHTAEELMDSPIFMREQNLGEPINGSFSEFSPVVSDQETMIVFSKSLQFYDAILVSTKIDGRWAPPMNMNELLKVDRDIYPSSFTKDGKTLYLYSSLGYDGNIYTTQFNNGNWSAPVILNNNINTKYWESHATVSHDNKKLYFTSNRIGGYGGLDIYVANRDSTGDWGTPVNLGPVINTRYNENTPFLSSDDKTLFFSSRGHRTMGGYDIFYSMRLDNGEWSAPLNAGYPLNSTDDDLFYRPVYDGFEGYLARYDPDGLGGQDIYRTEIFNDQHPRKFFVTGNVKVTDNKGNVSESVQVKAVRRKNTNKEIVAFSNPETGDYSFVAPHGNYEITYDVKNSEKVVKNFDFPLRHPSDSFHLPGIVLQKIPGIAVLQNDEEKKATARKTEVPLDSHTPQKRPRSVSSSAAANLPSNVTQYIETPVKQASVPSGIDPEIAIIREKILTFGERNEDGKTIKQSVDKTDQAGINKTGDWLHNVYKEGLKLEMPAAKLNSMLAKLSSTPGTGTRNYMEELAGFADEKLAALIKSVDPDKTGIKSPEDLLDFLIRNAERLNTTRREVFSSIGKLIASKDIPEEGLVDERLADGKGCGCQMIWILIGLLIMLLIIFVIGRKRKKRKEEEEKRSIAKG